MNLRTRWITIALQRARDGREPFGQALLNELIAYSTEKEGPDIVFVLLGGRGGPDYVRLNRPAMRYLEADDALRGSTSSPKTPFLDADGEWLELVRDFERLLEQFFSNVKSSRDATRR